MTIPLSFPRNSFLFKPQSIRNGTSKITKMPKVLVTGANGYMSDNTIGPCSSRARLEDFQEYAIQ